jgi:hypothetical protein
MRIATDIYKAGNLIWKNVIGDLEEYHDMRGIEFGVFTVEKAPGMPQPSDDYELRLRDGRCRRLRSGAPDYMASRPACDGNTAYFSTIGPWI